MAKVTKESPEKEQLQTIQSQSRPQPIPVAVLRNSSNQNQETNSKKEDTLSTSSVGGVEVRPKKLTKREQEWFDFTKSRLGPIMVLLLFMGFHNWEKATFYAFSPKECSDMALPMSHIMPRFESWLEKVFHVP